MRSILENGGSVIRFCDGEDNRLAERFADLIARFLPDEELRQAVRPHVGDDALRVDAQPGEFQRLLVDVRGEHLHGAVLAGRRHLLHQQHGQGIRFLAGGAAGDPDAQRFVGLLGLDQRRNGLLAQFLERLGVPEERRDVDQQVLEQLVDLIGVLRSRLLYWATSEMRCSPIRRSMRRRMVLFL